MKAIIDHIEKIKQKPHHHRKQIAYAYASVITAVIVFVWLSASLATGAFYIKDSSLTRNGDTQAESINSSQIAGVSAFGQDENANSQARIIIIDSASSSSKTKQPEKTVLPF